MSNISGVTQSNAPIYVNGSNQQEQVTSQPLQLRNGSAIQGTVVSVTDSEEGKLININVGDNVLSAKLSEDMNLREGQTLSFTVKSSGNGTVSITPLYENMSVDQSTLKALTAAGIEINNDTVQMVRDMMSASLPIDKNSLLEMNRNLSTFPNASVTTLVEMKSLNIPITENNIEQFTNYKNYEHQVLNEMESIMDELPTAFSELVDSGNVKGAMDLYGSVLKLFSDVQEPASADTATLAQVSENAAETENAEISAEGKSVPIQQEVADVKNQALQFIPEEGNEAAKIPGSVSDKENPSQVTAKDIPDNSSYLKGDLKGFDDALRNIGVSEKTISNLMTAARKEGISLDEQSAVLKELSTLFDEADMSNPAEAASWKNLFSNDNYNKILKNSIESQWLLKPGDVLKKENIDNLYQRLGNQAKALAETINNTLGDGSKLAQSANNLSNNLDFMNQINQMFQYVQLPLQMTQQNAHGDLYVYRNKNKRMSEDGSVSAILHLDMENLGPVDVYVKMTDNKVNTNFYVADDSVIDLINDNIHILNERLEKRGYSMTVRMHLQDEMDGEDSAVDEMFEVNKMPIISTASFDARA
ncbi:flagellar hook-length control protein FliK [Butyrivibrio sp. DSM 10294]|uniref:flagellar hook-length control protein FliK n=1 Tax=Butyrivibrio sp. DSM 10294 TaxID=2972457 RepID=UPI00234F48C6|nr:flagellar hook-length control protein FliK [Butyrivibrio sp. DSM 10294]MDC7295154.1 flagellar hook-length control protein FliK [Butyrivibrio sp. DSM 10294]